MSRSPLAMLVVAGVIVVGLWGTAEHVSRQKLLVRRENRYRHAYSELTFHTSGLSEELGKMLISQDTRARRPALARVYAHVVAIRQLLGQLPLVAVDLTGIDDYLHRVETAAIGRLTAEDDGDHGIRQEFTDLYKQARFLDNGLQALQWRLRERQWKWTRLEDVLIHDPPDVEPASNRGLTGDDRDPDQENEDPDPGISLVRIAASLESMGARTQPDRSQEKVKPEEVIDHRQALDIAGRFLKTNSEDLQVTGEIGGKVPAYRIERPGVVAGEPGIALAVGKLHGEVIWMISDASPAAGRVQVDDTLKAGERFLRERGFTNMEVLNFRKQGDEVSVNYVFRMADILVICDRVVLDIDRGGRIIGYNALQYLLHHRPRTVILPRLSQAEVQEQLSSDLKVIECQKALVNVGGEELLVYRFVTELEDMRYVVYLNALTGEEERVVLEGKEF